MIPEWADVEKELTGKKKSGVTLWLLWEEYRGREPQGLGYSQFCRLFKDYRKRKDIPLHHPHAPGQELYVDYSGQRSGSSPRGDKSLLGLAFRGGHGAVGLCFWLFRRIRWSKTVDKNIAMD